METLVLCPEELCLGPSRVQMPPPVPGFPMLTGQAGGSDYSIWTTGDLEKGTRFLPWKGTVRSDKLPVHDKLPEFDVRHRFGLYDEISEVLPGRRLRQCNWIRFLRYSLVASEEVNVVVTKPNPATGEAVFELVKDVGPKTELVAFFVPERPAAATEELNPLLLPAIHYLRQTLFKRILDNVLEESPLDLSNSLVMSKVFNPAHAAMTAMTAMTQAAAMSASAAALHASHQGKGAVPPLPTPMPAGAGAVQTHSPTHSVDAFERKSVSSDCTTSTVESTDSKPPTTSAEALAAAARRSLLSGVHHPHHLATHLPLATPPPHPPTSISTALSSRPAMSVSESPSPHSPSVNPSSPPTTTLHHTPSVGRHRNPANPTTTRRREKNMLPCNYCGKAFDRPSLLKRHIRIHTGERPHVCDICSKGFSTSSSLNTHRRIHSGEKPHQCGVCGKRFTASSNLYYHKMTHIKEKPHKCKMCSKSFPTPGDLKSHTYVHTGTWPYKCHVCHRGFSKQTNLKNHLLLHSGDKPFSCDICQKKFALGCNLRAHLRTHEAEYQSSPASLELYRRTLEMLAAQDAAGSGKSSPGASDLGQDGLESGLDEEEEEEVDLGMEDVEEDEVDPGSNEPVAAPSDGKIVSDKDKLLMSSLPKFAAAAAAAAAAVPAV